MDIIRSMIFMMREGDRCSNFHIIIILWFCEDGVVFGRDLIWLIGRQCGLTVKEMFDRRWSD
jgi:hypothetical protein